MARKATKHTPKSAGRSSSKRPAPEKPTPTRQSKRAKATPSKAYVEPDSDNDDDNPSSADDAGNGKASEYDDDEESQSVTSGSDHEEPSSEDVEPKKGIAKGRGRHVKKDALPMRKKQADEKELWQPGAKLTPGTQLIIKKPKARDAGSVAYTDETLHPNTMLFLKDLAANNDRKWLKSRFLYLTRI
jgi:hypothetical protein